MDFFANPFVTSELTSPQALENLSCFESLLAEARTHRFYAHPFLSLANRPDMDPAFVSHVLTSFYKVVLPFTGLLCRLAGRAPSLRARFVILDNMFEEMGRGDLSHAHPTLYEQMLMSIGVATAAAHAAPTLPAIRRINGHLEHVIEEQPFPVACALLAAAEATIPATFPVLAALGQHAFESFDTAFFDRHGARDAGHASDAATCFAVTAEPSHLAAVRTAIAIDLDARSALFDAWVDWLQRSPSDC